LILSGSHPHTLDAKGRVAIPSRLREQVIKAGGDVLMLMPALKEAALNLYPEPSWQKLHERILNIDNPVKKRAFQRVVLGSTHQVGFDGQGRILIPNVLREKAGLRDEVMIVGEGDHLALWAPGEWHKSLADSMDEVVSSDALIAELGV